MRAVVLDLDGEMVQLYVFFDGPISDEDADHGECIATELLAHFPDNEFESYMVRADYPQQIPPVGEIIYQRYEEPVTPELAGKRCFRLGPEVRFAAHRSLVGVAPLSLRNVSIDRSDNGLVAYCCFDGAISDLDHTLMERFTNRLAATLGGVSVVLNLSRVDAPGKALGHGDSIYARYESDRSYL